MVLNYIWIAFFALAFIVAAVRLIFFGDTEIFPAVINSTFESSKTAFEISIGLTGVLSLWLGIMKIGEKGGVVNVLSRVLSPLFCKLFPDIPKGHPVTGSIFMNLAANMLGLDNAATPLGLKAMEGLQELNPKKDTASNPMIMFLVLNTSGLTLIPISIMVYRAQLGAAQPTDVFVPILLATFFSTLAGIIAVSIYQKINLLNRTILLFLGGASLFIACLIFFFSTLSREQINTWSTTIANVLLFTIIISFIWAGARKKVNVYCAKEGQRVRRFCGRSERRIHNRHPHHSLPRGDTSSDRGVPRFGMHGLSDPGNRTAGRTLRHRQSVRRSSPHRPHETAERKRGARPDGRCHEHIRSRLFRRPPVVHFPGLYRHYILYPCRILRKRRHLPHEAFDSLRTAGRPCRSYRFDFHLLSVLLKYYATHD